MVIRRTSRMRRELTGGHILQLACGQDFFDDGFGRFDSVDLAAMRFAWKDSETRQRVYERQAAKFPDSKPFAEIAFGPDGDANPMISAADLSELREEYRAQRDAALAPS